MKNFSFVLAAILALTLSTFGTAAAQSKGARDGAQKQRHLSRQQRAGSRKSQYAPGGREAGRHTRWHEPRRHPRVNKRIWRMKGKHYRGATRGYRQHKRIHRGFRQQRRYYRGFHHPRRHRPRVHRIYSDRIYPVYEQSAGPSLGFDIETQDFRFSINKSE